MTGIEGLEVSAYDGPNYRALTSFGSWRVAMLNHGDKFAAEHPARLERHLETDEVFVLLEGNATLWIGREVQSVRMERNRLYNVTRGTWHQIHTEPGARCLIVENGDTSSDNSEYLSMPT